ERRHMEALLRDLEQQAAAPMATSTAPPLPATTSKEIRPEPALAEHGKNCPRCGADNRRAARFCRQCGHTFIAPLPPVLALVEPQGARWEFPLNAPSALVGRRGGRLSVDLDLEFYDPEGYVSRNHARIEQRQRRFYIIDLHSANGTLVNEERLTPGVPRLLHQGDRIRLGR
ncbi:MAG: FHA domain-containing protein, partial [Chloroflexi bacterium]|nr:FHA domain-containing protein [Chloroflexota bacterium]